MQIAGNRPTWIYRFLIDTMIGFLDLPSAIRHRIYCEAGLVTDATLNALSPTKARIPNPYSLNWTTTDLKFSLGLFLTCRAINAEVSSLFFSTNQFVVGPKAQQIWAETTLDPLQCLVRSSRGRLRSLVVDLNVFRACHLGRYRDHGHPLDATSRRLVYSTGDYPLVSLSSDTERLDTAKPIDRIIKPPFSSNRLTEWLDTAKAIGPLFKPQSLDLSLSCDVADLKTAEAVAASLEHFPTLRCCDLRLTYMPDAQIQGIAKQAAIRAVGQAPSPSSPFRFTDLPADLRLEILGYTDLITPLKEVEWNPKDGYYLRYRDSLCNTRYDPGLGSATCPETGDWVPDHRVPCDKDFYHHSCQFRNCWRQDLAKRGCFCRRYHAAYSVSSPRKCACWMPPQPLFLVCKQMYEDAQYIFFSHNRIIVTPTGGLYPDPEDPPVEVGLYPASIFLRAALPPSTLRYLRFLDIIFAPVNEEPGNDDPAFLEWKQTVEWARDKLDLPRLTLRVEIADYYGEKLHCKFRPKLTHNTILQIRAGYEATLRPLETLGSPALLVMSSGGEGGGHGDADGDGSEGKGLYRFFVHLANPYSDAERSQACYGLEETVERRVMGEEYDGEKMGKWGVKQGEWKWEIDHRYKYRQRQAN